MLRRETSVMVVRTLRLNTLLVGVRPAGTCRVRRNMSASAHLPCQFRDLHFELFLRAGRPFLGQTESGDGEDKEEGPGWSGKELHHTNPGCPKVTSHPPRLPSSLHIQRHLSARTTEFEKSQQVSH